MNNVNDLCSGFSSSKSIVLEFLMAESLGEGVVKKRRIGGGFPEELARAGREKYGEALNFQLGFSALGGSHVAVSSKLCHFHPPAGTISRARVIVQEDGNFNFQILLQSKESGKLETVDEFYRLCEMMKFCPGIDADMYEATYFSKIRYHMKTVHCSEIPFRRIDSTNCSKWHKLAKNASIIEKDMDSVPCSACKRLISDLNQRLKTAVSSPNKVKRQQPDSHCPLKYMSPSSQKKRKEYTQRDRAKHKKLLRKYSHTEVTLDDEQHEELSQLVNAIDENGSADLDELLQDADSYGMKDAVSEIWQMDKGRMKEIFDAEQCKNCRFIIVNVYTY